MSSRITLFDSPLFLGFDRFEKTIDRMQKASADGYPPYNIEQIGENGLRITLAVAGFAMDDLDIEIENNQLTIRGRRSDEENSEDRIFIHRGIAGRRFQRSFILADGVEARDAELDNGLLHINLEHIIPEPAVKKVKIKTPGNNKGSDYKALSRGSESVDDI